MYPEIRLASRNDAGAILEIEETAFPCPWDPEDILQCIDHPACRTWTARSSGCVSGYVSACLEKSGLHVVNLAVAHDKRRMGIGSALLRTAEGWGERLGSERAYLEVRKGSAPARELYGRAGYVRKGSLPEFYPDGEDGLELERGLAPDRERAIVARGIVQRCGRVPGVGVVLGSGLAWLADHFGVRRVIDYDDILEDSLGHVPGHPGRLAFSRCGRFVFLLGRRHHYQGYSGSEISLLPGVLGDLGAARWILTSSSGAVDPSLEPGDAVLFGDHVNFTGCVPDIGPARVRPSVYSETLRIAAEEAASETGSGLRRGLFACVSGPAYETSAEIGFLQKGKFSTVSMSTAPEALALSAAGFEVAAVSLVTNSASPGAVLTHGEVLDSQKLVREKQGSFMKSFLEKVASIELR